jgi:2-C-methyl-D-erythritol 4-phosphate cytidylyltransferase/2-C-methyl-D-erythritol 2,4-cyclodiphosphate synthase
MMLGGVDIDAPFGFKAHSDGDVALHALIDALLGAAGVGDIGELFPDTDAAYEGIDSKLLLERAVTMIHNFGFEIINVDITIMAQTPKLMNYKQKMAGVIAKILGIAPIHVNVKATTTEKLGFVGRKEGVAVDAIANLKYYNWMER